MITLDFETYYAKGYDLRILTTENYIRSPEFQAIGVGFKEGANNTEWVTGEAIAEALQDLRLHEKEVLAHNMAFDGAILNWHYGIRPMVLRDTLSMARPMHRVIAGGSLAALAAHYQLGSKGTAVHDFKGYRLEHFTPEQLSAYGDYCCTDVDLTYDLYHILAAHFNPDELSAIDLTLRMFTEPTIELNEKRLRNYRDEVVKRKTDIIKATGLKKTQLMSNPQFAKVLESYGQEAPTKISPRTGKEAFAFSKQDKGMQALANSDRPIIAALAKARLAVKSTIAETRADSLAGVSQRGALPVMLNYYGAHTGRFSGGDKLNLQNFPKRSGDIELRASLRAPPEHVVLACDLSQIEARVVAWLSGQQDLTALFAKGEDVYSHFAAKAFGIPVEEVSKDQRFIGKTCILGLGYGMGAKKLRETFRIMAGRDEPMENCERYVHTYRDGYRSVTAMWKTFDLVLAAMVQGREPRPASVLKYSPAYWIPGSGAEIPDVLSFTTTDNQIIMPNGLAITYHGLTKQHFTAGGNYVYVSQRNQIGKDPKDWTPIYGGKVSENVIQGLSALIVRWQMVRIMEKLGIRAVFQVHDELVYIVTRKLAGYYAAGIKTWMRTAPPWATGLPVSCEISVGLNYGELRELG
jgi:DNA polymerase